MNAEKLILAPAKRPAAVQPVADVLEINSNEGLNRVPIRGQGVALTPEDQIAEIVRLIDEAVADGTLRGGGPGRSGPGRLRALAKMIRVAQRLIEAGAYAQACDQLLQTLLRTDGNPRPPDFVTGPAASELAALIEKLRANIGCR